MSKKKKGHGAYVSWRDKKTCPQGRLIETKGDVLDPDTPAGFYQEPTRSTFEQVQKVRGR